MGSHADSGKTPNEETEMKEGSSDVDAEESTVPSLSQIFAKGAPPEYVALMVIGLLMCVIIIVMFIRAIARHRSYTTKHTMQALCTLGIIFTIPVFAIMYMSGIIVPKAMAKVTFLAETYEALSLIFFLRLILTYMGGKKMTNQTLKNIHVQLNNPPICCFFCLPHIRFSRKFLFINELFILQLVVFQVVLGFIDLLIGLDESHQYPTALIEEKYSYYFHIFILFSLLLAIYGIGGIYHSAEAQLKHHHIFYKFAIYKVFVTVVKIEEVLVTYAANSLEEHMRSLQSGAFSGHVRVHIWLYFLIIAEALITFPFLIRAYSTKDYPKQIVQIKLGNKEGEEDEIFEEEGTGTVNRNGGYTSFPLSASKDFENVELGSEQSDDAEQTDALLRTEDCKIDV